MSRLPVFGKLHCLLRDLNSTKAVGGVIHALAIIRNWKEACVGGRQPVDSHCWDFVIDISVVHVQGLTPRHCSH
jgi:hypothetical protein